MESHQIPFQAAAFPSSEELLKQFDAQENPFDLLLLDIQMDGMNGMELAKELRRKGDSTRLLFITGIPDYALEGYEVHPVHYLLKQIKPAELEKILERDWEENHHRRTALFPPGSEIGARPVRRERFTH